MNGNKNRSRNFGRHRDGRPAVREISAEPSVVRDHLAGRERSLGRQAVSRSYQLAAGRRDAAGMSRIIKVEECKPGNAPRLVFSSMDASVATEIEQAFAQAGHVVVSNSRNHRMEPDVPLLIPGDQSRSLEDYSAAAAPARLEGADRDQSELLHDGAGHGARAAEAVRHYGAWSPPRCRPFRARVIRASLPWTSTPT